MRTIRLLLVFALLVSAAFAQSTWSGAASGSWSDPANWVGGVPAAASSVTVPAGTPNAPSTSGLGVISIASLTVNAGASVAVGAGDEIAVSGSVTVNGTVSGAGRVSFVGAGSASLSGAGALPSVQISKTAGSQLGLNGNITVNGGLSLQSGSFVVSFGAFTMTVNGNASMTGGTLTISSIGTLDVNGNVTFAGAACTSSPNILCSGSWTASAAYAPSPDGSGTVTFDGAAPQAATGAGNFSSLRVVGGSALTTAIGAIGTVTIDAGGSLTTTTGGSMTALTVNGALVSTAGPLDVNSTVSIGGTWTFGAQSNSVAGSLSGAGTMTGTGTLVLDGGGANISGPANLPSVQIAKIAGNQLGLNGNITVNGGLSLQSGTFVVSFGTFTMTVNGNASFTGGTLTLNSLGTLDVNGNVTFAGAACSSSPDIRCAGNWTSDASYAPTSGSLTFDGTTPATIEVLNPTNTLQLSSLTFDGSLKTAISNLNLEIPTISVLPAGGLSAGSRAINLHRTSGTTTLTVDGTLEALAGGRFECGPQTTVLLRPSSTLRLLGTPLQRAAFQGDPTAGGNYALTVQGAVAARNFSVLRPNSSGMVVASTATFAPAPNDFRGGLFDLPATTANSTLLTIERPTATDIRYAEFRNTNNTAGVFNVTCTAGAAITMQAFAGPFGGAAFERDPGNRIQWVPPVQSSVLAFEARAAIQKVTLQWDIVAIADTADWVIDRSDGGPFVTIVNRPDTGARRFQFVDQPLVAGTTYTYRLFERLTHGALVQLATATATPFTAAPPANVLTVGPSGAYPTPQAAVNAAVAGSFGDAIIQIAPGTYPAFTVSQVPFGGMQIVGQGPGVVIDTSAAAVVVQNVIVPTFVMMSDLEIGSASSANSGLVVQNCSGMVLLDESTVASGPGSPAAVSITGSTRAIVQRSSVSGGLSVGGTTFAAISSTTVDALTVLAGAYVQTCAVTAATSNVAPGAVREDLPGPMPEVVAPEIFSLGTPVTVSFRGAPSSVFGIAAELAVGFMSAPGSGFELPALLAYQSPVLLVLDLTDATGDGGASPLLPNDPRYLGLQFFLQAAQFSPAGLRFSNLEGVTVVE